MLCARAAHPDPSLVWAAPAPEDPDSAFFLDDDDPLDAMYGDFEGLMPRRGLLARLGRALKKEVTGHGPPEARLSGVIFLQRNTSVRQLPSIAPKRDRVVRLPRARAMRPVRGSAADPDPAPPVIDPEPRPLVPPRAMRWRPGRPRAQRDVPDRDRVERVRSLPLEDAPTEPPSNLPRARRRTPTLHYRARSSSPAPAVRRESSPVPRYEKVARRAGDPMHSLQDTALSLPRPRSRADPNIVMLQPPPSSPMPQIERATTPVRSPAPSELSVPISEFEEQERLNCECESPESESGTSSEVEAVDVEAAVIHIDSDECEADKVAQHDEEDQECEEDDKECDVKDQKSVSPTLRSPMLSSSGGASNSEASTNQGWLVARSDGSTIKSEGTPSPQAPLARLPTMPRRRPAWEASRRPAWVAKRSDSDVPTSSVPIELTRAERQSEPVSERARHWPHPPPGALREAEGAPGRRLLPRTARLLAEEEERQKRAQSDFTAVLGMRHDDFIDFQCRPRNRARGMRILSNVSSAFVESDDESAFDEYATATPLSAARRPVASVLRRARLLNRFA